MDSFRRRPAQPPAISTRAAERDSLFLLTSLSSADGHCRGKVRVRNLSALGLMADCPVQVAKGERVVLDVRGIGPVSGTVAWVRAERIGVAFDETVDPKKAREPVRRSSNAMPDYLRPVRKIR